VMDEETAKWLAKSDDAMHAKLAAVALVKPRETTSARALAAMIDAYIARRSDVKPITVLTWNQAKRYLVEFFTSARLVALIKSAECDDFRRWLRAKFSEAYTSKMIMICKAFFRDAARRGIITVSPFIEVRNGSQVNQDRRRYIDAGTIQKVLDAAPSNEWRLIIVLARYGGLRVPSELSQLKWGHIHWQEKRIVVTSPKTEHHEGQGTRICPLFPEVEEYLRLAYDAAPEGEEYVIREKLRLAPNLRKELTRIIERAGVVAWPKLFQNLRASRATDLADQFPSHVGAAWLGHAEEVAKKHYRTVTDEHFAKAISKQAAQNPAQHTSADTSIDKQLESEGNEKQAVLPSGADVCNAVHVKKVGDKGLEPLTFRV